MSRSKSSTIKIILDRQARGYMPKDIDQLLDQRGTIETAAADLAQFTGYSFGDCLEALREVYDL